MLQWNLTELIAWWTLMLGYSSTGRKKSHRSDWWHSTKGNEQSFILMICLYKASFLAWHLSLCQVIAKLWHSHRCSVQCHECSWWSKFFLLSFLMVNSQIKIIWMSVKVKSHRNVSDGGLICSHRSTETHSKAMCDKHVHPTHSLNSKYGFPLFLVPRALR